MKTNFLFSILLFSFLSIQAQVTTDIKSDWGTVVDNESVEISSRIIEVNDAKNGIYKEYYQYRFTNKTSTTLNLSWYFNYLYNNHSSRQGTTLSQENYRAISLEPEQIFTPQINNVQHKNLFVFKRFLKMRSNVNLESVTLQQLLINQI